MNLSSLKPATGSVKNGRRIGRGVGSGSGKTAGRGHKGAKSRSGYSKKAGFEGGQMPLQRRLPKFGFTNHGRVEYKGINLDTIQSLVEKTGVSKVDFQVLRDNGLASKNDLVKILGRGELKAKVELNAHAFTVAAKEAVEKAGGSVAVI